jgi:hypothetical protein
MNRIMIEAFVDELNAIEKEAFVGKTIRWTKKLLTRGKGAKGAKGVTPKPAPQAAEHTAVSGSGTNLPQWGDMDEATRAAAKRLQGPIGAQYRSAAEAATKKPSPADIMKRLQAKGGPSTPAPGALPGGGPGAPTPPAAVFGGAAPAAAAPVKTTGKTRIFTAEQIARNPQMATKKGLEAAGGTGLHPEMFQKGKFMGFSSGGKPVYAHAMRKFAQAGLFPHLLAKKRARAPS